MCRRATRPLRTPRSAMRRLRRWRARSQGCGWSGSSWRSWATLCAHSCAWSELHPRMPQEQADEPPGPERPQLLRAAIRALLAENRSLQARLESASEAQGSGGPTSSRPSAWRPSSASRGTRLGKAGGAFVTLLGYKTSHRPASPALELRGVPPTPAAAAGALPGPGGFMRQPVAPDEAARLPRSATDRGTASQRKALERLRAAQARHDEAAEAAAAQRQKLLPLIRWHDAARADAAAADRQELPGSPLGTKHRETRKHKDLIGRLWGVFGNESWSR
eukprot:s3573_g3.t2